MPRTTHADLEVRATALRGSCGGGKLGPADARGRPRRGRRFLV